MNGKGKTEKNGTKEHKDLGTKETVSNISDKDAKNSVETIKTESTYETLGKRDPRYKELTDTELQTSLTVNEGAIMAIFIEAKSRGFIIQKTTVEGFSQEKAKAITRELISTQKDPFVPASVSQMFRRIEQLPGSDDEKS